MRVLHVITGLDAGGAEQWLRLLLRHSAADADVLALTNAGVLADAIRSDGVSVTDLGMRGNRDLAAIPRLVAHVRRGRYDLVHTHLYRAQLYGAVAALLSYLDANRDVWLGWTPWDLPPYSLTTANRTADGAAMAWYTGHLTAGFLGP